MRILFLCDEYPPASHGGLGTFVQGMSRHLSSDGHTVVVVGAYKGISKASVELDGKVAVHRLPVAGGPGRLGFLRGRLAFAEAVQSLVNRLKIDIVEGFESGGWLLFLRLPCPLVVRLHNPRVLADRVESARRGLLLSLSERLALRRASKVIAVSKFLASRASRAYRGSGLQEDRIRVIANGVDFSSFKQQDWRPTAAGRIVFAGTIKPQKGVRTLLKAFSEVSTSNTDAHLLIAGKDTQPGGTSYMKSLIQELALPQNTLSRIEWLGHVPVEKLGELYASSEVCVFPSLFESFGLVAVEAMACGRPVLFSQRCAGPEIIDHGRTGFLVDPENSIEIAERVLFLLRNRPAAEAMGAAAAVAARERFSIATCAQLSLALYSETLEEKAVARKGRD